ncbi:hypothetical protein FKP32DRAFT_542269 [Trametes sanguinea]|nr:hypothetical protein FKP32DRAFT_542269 [Trametes sanguinea]
MYDVMIYDNGRTACAAHTLYACPMRDLQRETGKRPDHTLTYVLYTTLQPTPRPTHPLPITPTPAQPSNRRVWLGACNHIHQNLTDGESHWQTPRLLNPFILNYYSLYDRSWLATDRRLQLAESSTVCRTHRVMSAARKVRRHRQTSRQHAIESRGGRGVRAQACTSPGRPEPPQSTTHTQ